jgi:hypothetical protein
MIGQGFPPEDGHPQDGGQLEKKEKKLPGRGGGGPLPGSARRSSKVGGWSAGWSYCIHKVMACMQQIIATSAK